MFKTPIYAIRHGATAWNEAGRFQGRSDIPLSEAGRRQARAVGVRLRALTAERPDLTAPSAILASPLSRAVETADIVRDCLGLPGSAVTVDRRLVETGFGAWEGLTTMEVKQRFPEQRRSRKADRWAFSPPGGQSCADLEEPMRHLIAETLERGSPTLFVTHSGNLRVLMAIAGGVERPEAARAAVRHESVFVGCEGGFFTV